MFNSAISLCLLIWLLPAQCAQAQDLKIVDPLTVIRTAADLRDARALPVLRLVGPRNGFVSGLVVATGPHLKCLKAQLTPLRGPGGSIAPRAVQIRYASKASPRPLEFTAVSADSNPNVSKPYFDVLNNLPPRDADILPIWLTVKIPADLKPGKYIGTLTFAANKVPVELQVCKWVCPAPRDWLTHVGVLSSPETLAKQYNVKLWSPQHWELIERQLQFLGGLGNDDLWLSIFSRNQWGHETSWITYKEKDGQYHPDLSIVSKYLDLYAKHVGQPHALILEMWNSTRYASKKRVKQTQMDILVDGQSRKVPLPGFEGSDAIFEPVLQGIRRLVVKLGWSENIIMIGCADDKRPTQSVINFFKKHAPYARWAIWTHGRGDSHPWKGKLKLDGMDIGHLEHVFCPWLGYLPKNSIIGGWNLEFPEYATSRNYLVDYVRLAQYRSFAEGNVVNRQRASKNMARSSAGFTRLALDYWPVEIKGRQSPTLRSLLFAYEPLPWTTLYRNSTRAIIAPGPDGPLGTVRYEMLREGLQECEARIVIEKALLQRTIAPSLEKRCRDLLRQRLAIRERNATFKGGSAGNVLGSKDRLWGISENWPDSTAQLFNLAGQVNQTLE